MVPSPCPVRGDWTFHVGSLDLRGYKFAGFRAVVFNSGRSCSQSAPQPKCDKGIDKPALPGGLVLRVACLLDGVDIHQILEHPERKRFRIHEGRIRAVIKLIRPNKSSEILLNLHLGEHLPISESPPNGPALDARLYVQYPEISRLEEKDQGEVFLRDYLSYIVGLHGLLPCGMQGSHEIASSGLYALFSFPMRFISFIASYLAGNLRVRFGASLLVHSCK